MILLEERKKKIVFKKDVHKYFIDDVEYRSMTTMLHDYAPQFNSKAVAEKKSEGSFIKETKLLNEWFMNREIGTLVHYYLELYCLDKKVPTNELITDDIRALYNKLDVVYSDDIEHYVNQTTNLFIAGRSFLFDMAKKGYYPYQVELRCHHEEWKIAGTMDLCLKHETTGDIILSDWKCTNGIYFKGFSEVSLDVDDCDEDGIPVSQPTKIAMFFDPISHLESCNGNLYSLQLCGYERILMEKCGFPKPSQCLIVHLKKKESDYKTYDILDLRKEFNQIITHYQENKK